MTVTGGQFEGQSTEDILDAMIADAKEYFGEDLNDASETIIRTFYRPIAERLAEAQDDIGLVLRSAQIDHAEGKALDLLTALIGITRDEADKATGTAKFSRSDPAPSDYVIPEGTVVQTDSIDPIQFETTEGVILEQDTTSVTASIKAVNGGPEANVGPNTLTVMPDPPTGIENVTNPAETTGGSARETDDELRQRAKEELAEGSRASSPALVNSTSRLDGVTSVSIFVNDTNEDNTGSGGLPDHSFELVIAGGNDQEIAQTILETKAAGDTSYAGANGVSNSATAELPNGQTQTISFSRPDPVKIYVDVTVTKTDEFAGTDEVKDAIVEYIGGIRTSGNDVTGLGVGEDVIYTEVLTQIHNVRGVYDVPSLEIGISSSPTGTSNISISQSDVATADGLDDSLSITTENA